MVSSGQIEGFKKWIGPGKVTYIPHGIDTELFSPGKRSADRSRVLVLIVGVHLRDWEVVHKVIDQSDMLGLSINFHVVMVHLSRRTSPAAQIP